MTILVGVTTAYTTGATLDVDVPPGTVNGDHMLLYWSFQYSYFSPPFPSVNPPAGWVQFIRTVNEENYYLGTAVGTGGYTATLGNAYRKAAGEPVKYTISNAGALVPMAAVMVCLRGAIGDHIDLYWAEGYSKYYDTVFASPNPQNISLFWPPGPGGLGVGSVTTTPLYVMSRADNCTFAADSPFTVFASTSNVGASMAVVGLPGFADMDLQTMALWSNWVGGGYYGGVATKKVQTSAYAYMALTSTLWIRDTLAVTGAEQFSLPVPFIESTANYPVDVNISLVPMISDDFVSSTDIDGQEPPDFAFQNMNTDLSSPIGTYKPLDPVAVNTVIPIVDD